ncbi:hypothetical protein GOARA_064_02050 [Gordonia araii NBRC 100433]|uniref:DUF58 domain-containing protein n=1 Tax=Gordonia araii NBRC 100433 TaxID=1073574 RepID=G7H5S8_9ACTN|nr:DUF58 domain-containing protein [Gordonia araii]NNG95913.1 DUF58 domain-containing protein [Gordonia araii NBRC 100433]GAB11203.1 hypothetical protein GOARA_064_02050 [Gordonia araii NBRC 100433]
MSTVVRPNHVPIVWRPSPLTMSLATCAAVAVALAVLAGRWQLFAFAAPMVGILAATARPRDDAAAVWVRADPSVARCFEAETIDALLYPECDAPQSILTITGVDVDPGVEVELDPGAAGTATIRATAERWGRYRVGTHVQAITRSGFFAASVVVPAVDLWVFPVADPPATPLPDAELPDRIGTHLTRHHGLGVEYADIRPYVPGDQLRAVNWRVSARRGQLHVTDRFTDRSADLVVVLDTHPQPRGPATAASDRVARGATQVVDSALQAADRVGVVTLGRQVRWLRPDIGRRQFYRVLDTILDADDAQRDEGTLVPRMAMPPNAIVIAFSTLLDTDFALALVDLRTRGHRVVAVDVLPGSPFADDTDATIARWWRLERSGMYRDLTAVGVDLVAWHPDVGLHLAMHVLGAGAGTGRRR